jgi:hypothetical protein
MTDWIAFENGTTVGATGSEGGTILRDELQPDGARITVERTASGFAITCGVYGWMVHTRFFASEREAVVAYEEMKPALAEILARLPAEDDDVEAAVPQVAESLVASPRARRTQGRDSGRCSSAATSCEAPCELQFSLSARRATKKPPSGGW